jgi:hypothetical protein
MTATRAFRTLGVATGLTVASIALAGAAWAKPLEHGQFHEETTEMVEDFCEVPGLTVQLDRVLDVRVLANAHGPDGLAYFLEHQTFTEVWTNPANGNAFTVETMWLSKDLRVTDNGDGTLTILVLVTGSVVAYGPDGKAIFRDPGQFRFEFVVDDAGTPTDPGDDEFLEFHGIVKEPTGRTDDFCAATVPVLIG